MVFSGLLFLFIFLPIFLSCYYIFPAKYRNGIIFIFSLLFYAWGEPLYILIMLVSTVFDYMVGIVMDKYNEREDIRRMALIFSVIFNLGMLSFFKYSGFFLENINNVFGLDIGLIKVILPIGISFYTFQTMSYTIDLYKRKVDVQTSFISFGAYVSMFPQLIAGPIVRYSDVAKELECRKENIDKFSYGVTRFIEGLGKKVLVANNIGLLWDTVSNMDMSEMSILLYWLGIIAFALQIYFDFSGYSDMAIGLGSMIGFSFPENFNYPYIARSVTEFWRRWHITLGSWFREYLYIPLGGNRVSKNRLLFNILIVWFLTGFWHGADWNFILWGLYFAILMIVEKKILLDFFKRVPIAISRIYLILVVLVSWVIFSMDSVGQIFDYLKGMFGFGSISFIGMEFMYLMSNYWLILIIGVLMSTPIVNSVKIRLGKASLYGFYMTILILSTAYLVDSTFNPFLYFRF